MKRGIIIGALVAAIIGVACLFGIINSSSNSTIDTADKIYPASSETGGISENIVGSPDKASVIVYEYADFACSHCADWNKTINELMEKHDGKIALVFRSYDLGLKNELGFKNSPVAARAAVAAGMQGYFKTMKDLLFNNQTEWYYEEAGRLDEIFTRYFKEASGGAGDVNKFKEDMNSDAVHKKVNFENKMGEKINLKGTPTFRIDGEKVETAQLVETIESKIK